MIPDHTLYVLLGLGAMGATFAGFAGVVATFGRRAQGQWLPEERFRLTNMLVISLGACLMSFLPLLLVELFRIPNKTLWTIVSVLMGVFCAGYYAFTMPERRRLNKLRPGVLREWMAAVLTFCFALTFVLQLLNAIEMFAVERSPGVYLAGLSLLLIVAGFQFAFLVLTPLTPSSDENCTSTAHVEIDR